MIRTTLLTLALALVGGTLAAQDPIAGGQPPQPGDRPGMEGMDRPGPGGPGRPGQEGMDRPGPDGPGRPGPKGMNRPGPEGGHPMMIFKALDLSQDQDKAVKAALDKHRTGDKARRQAAMAQEEALHAALEDPATTEAQVKALHAAAAEAQLQGLLDHRALVQELNAILTPAQQAKAKRIRENLAKERAAHRALAEDLDTTPRT